MSRLLPSRALQAIAVTFTVVLLFRLGAHLRSPFISEDFLDARASRPGSFLQLKGEQVFSLFGLGVTPYISMLLIVSLLTRSVRLLGQWSEQGPAGAAKLRQLIRAGALALTAMMSVANTRPLTVKGGFMVDPTNGSWLALAAHVLFQLAGLLILLALAEVVTRNGIGNGVSILTVTTVLSSVPHAASQVGRWPLMASLSLVICTVVSVALLVAAGNWVRHEPLYSTLPISQGAPTGEFTMRVTNGGAGPLVFAGSLYTAVSALVKVIPIGDDARSAIRPLFDGHSTTALIVLAVLTVSLARFYASVASDPIAGANELARSGRFMHGVAPGLPTARKLQVMNNAAGWMYAAVLVMVVAHPVIIQAFSGVTALTAVSGGALVLPVLVIVELLRYNRRVAGRRV